jgi:hypothetical protein
MEVGVAVMVAGLKSRLELNDCSGVILGPCEAGRFPVLVGLPGGSSANVRVRPSNLWKSFSLSPCCTLITAQVWDTPGLLAHILTFIPTWEAARCTSVGLGWVRAVRS